MTNHRKKYKHNFKVALELVDSLKGEVSRKVSFSRTSNQRRIMLARLIEFGVLVVTERYYHSPIVRLNSDPLVIKVFKDNIRRIIPDCGLARSKGFSRMNKEEFIREVETIRIRKRISLQTYLINSPSLKLLAS